MIANKSIPPTRPPLRAGGFSLIEILVGLVIGLLGMIVMIQVFSVSESSKRTTTGSSDAQTSGAIALYSIQRDIRQSGYGMVNIKLIGCDVTFSGILLSNMAPVTINHPSVPPGDANTDTLLIVAGNANGSPEGGGITAQPATSTYTVQAIASFVVGDRVIAQPAISTGYTPSAPVVCNLTAETIASIPAGTNNLQVATGLAGVSGGLLYNMGAAPRIQAYAIRNNTLTECNFPADCTSAANVGNPFIWVPIASNMVSLRAQYGRNTNVGPMTGIVDLYDQSTPNTHCGWARTFTVRLALIARNANYDKAVATTAAPLWAGSADNAINVSRDEEWQHYRYKVFQTIIPIRNMVGIGVVPSLTSSGGASPCI
jgi:type IV pilus assembly protein PilW